MPKALFAPPTKSCLWLTFVQCLSQKQNKAPSLSEG
jgi:hypothetical protein